MLERRLYLVKCFVLFDLKSEELNRQDIGQVDMYVRTMDDLKRMLEDHPSVGIILCTLKGRFRCPILGASRERTDFCKEV